ncbi:xylulokinase [Staphylococcus gallinarum]|uniref:xylulokinase n=1 Tax=Staphylococcus gallinarum TaxID=1293 RepID=UPI001E4A328F|nr:xylulokinase [Staphylococcus gallinarum]MCD8901000.1 xylulokinase [Staphylococcus gallinarum]MCD8902638.1 xylulokinase [Staphylococcus gallinarum]
MNNVIGMDIGTSGLKTIVVDEYGQVIDSYSVEYKTEHPHTGYSEINPNIWYEAALESLAYVFGKYKSSEIAGLSFSGQMHGLVVVDKQGEVIRPAILWNDTRTHKEVEWIKSKLGLSLLLKETQNTVLEGFTLPKLIWLKNNEPEHYEQIDRFMLPKDYVAYKLTGNIFTEPSDASGTIMFNVKKGQWSTTILDKLEINPHICPDIIPSHGYNGAIKESIMQKLNVNGDIKVYQGGADNACGALGAGITDAQKRLVSIGTSGVALAIQNDKTYENDGKVHYFHHCVPEQKYIMGVTLSAGYSLEWLKNVLNSEENFDHFLKEITSSQKGSNGLLYTPYLLGERTPYNDSSVRGSFIGLDANTTMADMKRAVLEGVTFSIKDSLEIIKNDVHDSREIVSIGGGAKNKTWLQIQADIFDTDITTRTEEQGPAYGAAMLAAMGVGWFDSFKDLSAAWIEYNDSISSNKADVQVYKDIYNVYTEVYENTQALSKKLVQFK